MSLLFDQNISFKVAKRIQDTFPNSQHLSDINLKNYTDLEIWSYARINNYCIVTFDSDFIDLSNLKGSPPKIIWLRIGNTATEDLIAKIKAESSLIKEFLNSSDTAFLELK